MGSRLLFSILQHFQAATGRPLRTLPEACDPERFYHRETGRVLERRRTCFNHCGAWARIGDTVCSDACRESVRARGAARVLIGGTIVVPEPREQISGTRRPRELSSDGSGFSE